MVSKLKLEVDLSKELNAYLLEDSDLSDYKEKKAKLYIPVLMPKIELGDPAIKTCNTKGTRAFINDIGKPKVSSATLQERNYFESDICGTNSLQNMEADVSVIKKNFHTWVSESTGWVLETYPIGNTSPKLSYDVKKHSMCRCSFLNGKISKLSFTPNDNDTSTFTPTSDEKSS